MLVASAGFATAEAEVIPVSSPRVEVLAESSLPGDLKVDRTPVGGLSGLTYDPGCDLFYAISDDRGSLAPPRFYTLKIRFDGETVDAVVLEATLLRDDDGAPFPRGDLDPEALALTADGTLFVASEGVPHRGINPLVGRFRLDGSFNGALGLPEHFLPDAGGTRGVRDNLAFEGLAVSPDGSRLFVTTENALIQDGPAADLDVASPSRLLVFDVASGQPVAEYLYEVEPVPDTPKPATAFRTNGISEILALDNERLLVLERSFSVGVGNTVRIYLVHLKGAADIRDIDSIRDMDGPKPVPVMKTLVADLGERGIEPDNIEGMALGPSLPDGRRMLVLIADDNFQPSVQKNQIVILAASDVSGPVVSAPDATIHEIQGAGHVSPFVGRCVSGVKGVVTAVLGSRAGQAFWMQDPVGDGDSKTSEGLFVMTPEGLPSVEIGDRVRLWGRVQERSWSLELPVTRLFASDIRLEESHQQIPRPVVIGQGGVEIPQPAVASDRLEIFDPDLFAADAFESLEGMLVKVENPVVVGPTSRHGEIVVLTDGGDSAEERTRRGGLRLLAGNTNPQRIVIDDRLVAPPPDLQVGQSSPAPVEGVLHYSFGSYKLLNSASLPGFTAAEVMGEKTDLTGDASHLAVASFNLENLSAVSGAAKFAQLASIVVDNLGVPDIVAVQEVQDDSGPEDDGTVTARGTLDRLVEAIEGAGGPRYETRCVDPVDGADGGQTGTNIRPAFLFKPSRVAFVDRRDCPTNRSVDVVDGGSLSCSPGLVDPTNRAFRVDDTGRGGSRKPLVGEFRFAGRTIVLVNLHLSSKGGDDPIFGRRQPRVEGSSGRRTQQAAVVAEFAGEVLENDPDAGVIVLGDLNDFENSDALGALEVAGLEDLVKRLPLENRYSYVYLGNSQVLDHILVSESLADGVEIEIVHVNADFPASDRASDHDPVIVRLSIQ